MGNSLKVEVYSWENHLETVNFLLPYLDLTIKDDEDKPSTAGICQLDFMAILKKKSGLGLTVYERHIFSFDPV